MVGGRHQELVCGEWMAGFAVRTIYLVFCNVWIGVFLWVPIWFVLEAQLARTIFLAFIYSSAIVGAAALVIGTIGFALKDSR